MHFRRPWPWAEFPHDEQLSGDSGPAVPNAVAELKVEHFKTVEQVPDQSDSYPEKIYGVMKSESALINELRSDNFEGNLASSRAAPASTRDSGGYQRWQCGTRTRPQPASQQSSNRSDSPYGQIPGPAMAGMQGFPSEGQG
ncbi:hypothetical protein DL763_010041 [Monosporascus cannonballus]|nr:hypothetical protein DL763_010041 [Monosporascus cannonballus]